MWYNILIDDIKNMAVKRAKLSEKIKYVKKVLGTPYHFFYVSAKNNVVGVRLEDKSGKSFNFTGASMFDTIQMAEKYVADGIKEGNLKELELIIKSNETHENQ